MTPLDTVTGGLQILSSWVMSMLVLWAILVSVVICIALVECIFERGAIAQAYTVKNDSGAREAASGGKREVL
jgi:hypothetical protein